MGKGKKEDAVAGTEAAAEGTEEAVDATTETAIEAAEAAEEPATEAAEAAGEAVQAVGEAATEAAEVVTDTVEEAVDAATGTETAETPDPAQVLTVDGFEPDAALQLVNEADGLSDVSRVALRAAIEQARNNPGMVDEVVARLQNALGN